VKRAVATILKRDGGIDGLVISIGWAVAGTIEETSFEDWRKLSAVHLDGMFLTCREALKGLRNSGHGSIVIIGSMFGLKGKEGRLAYCTMKGGVVNFVRSLALDLAGSVRVNSICPGWVETEMSMRLVNAAEDPPAAWRDRQQWHPMGRGGKPEEVAELCVFMLSDRAGWMTGQNVALDGGATAR
jgi:NAD(P)-dependent dehydrogenase (short-subunit alcohol dehydrogenase family)